MNERDELVAASDALRGRIGARYWALYLILREHGPKASAAQRLAVLRRLARPVSQGGFPAGVLARWGARSLARQECVKAGVPPPEWEHHAEAWIVDAP